MASLVSEGRVYIRDATGHEEMYALDDPAEQRNLVGAPSEAEALAKCRKAFDANVPRRGNAR
jgi:hypothetical protein